MCSPGCDRYFVKIIISVERCVVTIHFMTDVCMELYTICQNA